MNYMYLNKDWEFIKIIIDVFTACQQLIMKDITTDFVIYCRLFDFDYFVVYGPKPFLI